MYETHQIQKSLSLSPSECFSACLSSAAPFHTCFLLREQLPQISGSNSSPKVKPVLNYFVWSQPSANELSKTASYIAHRTAVAEGKAEEKPMYFATEISDIVSLASHSRCPSQVSTEPAVPPVPSKDHLVAGLQNPGLCTQQNNLNADTQHSLLHHLWMCSFCAPWSQPILSTGKQTAWSLHTTVLTNKTCSIELNWTAERQSKSCRKYSSFFPI